MMITIKVKTSQNITILPQKMQWFKCKSFLEQFDMNPSQEPSKSLFFLFSRHSIESFEFPFFSDCN